MKIIIILLFFSISLTAQETVGKHQLLLKYEIGSGYSSWRTETFDYNLKGSGLNFCTNITPFYIYKNLMFGLSYGYEQLWIDTLINTSDSFPYGSGFVNNYVSFNKFSFALGYNFIHAGKIDIIADVHFGTYRLDKSFGPEIIKNRLIASSALNFRYTIGTKFFIFLEPLFEYKYYELDKDLIGGQIVNHTITSFNCMLGLYIKII